MLSIIPLVWFSGLFIYLYRTKIACLSLYATLMYVITSICAFAMYKAELISAEQSSVGLLSTLVYCVLITLSILPLYTFDKKGNRNIHISNPQLIKILIYFYFFCFFFLALFYWRDIVFRVALGDWNDVRLSAAMGSGYSVRQASGLLRPITIVLNVMSSISFVMLPVFFITMIYTNMHYRYSIMAMIGSLSTFIVAILAADRSRIFIWLIILGMCLFYFWKNLSDFARRRVITILITIVSLTVVYLVIVTISRYGDSEAGAFSSIVTYAGQPYHNFCYFFENFNNQEGVNTRVLLPFTHTLIIGDYVGGVDLQRTMTTRTGIYCGVFYTFLGTFILDSNQIGPFLYMILYLLLWRFINKNGQRTSLLNFFIVFFMAIIPTYGCISYMYSFWHLTVAVAIVLISCRITGNHKNIIDL